MTKRTHKGGTVLEIVESAPTTQVSATALEVALAPVVLVDIFGNEYTQADLAPKAPGPRTVVKTAYKHRYQDLAKSRGYTDKASRRGNGDWLQRELQAECNGKDGKFDLERFEAILAANGVDSSRWNRTTRGWEGRVRMSGSLVLRGVVGKSGVLRTTTGTTNVVELADGGDELAQEFLAKWAN